MVDFAWTTNSVCIDPIKNKGLQKKLFKKGLLDTFGEIWHIQIKKNLHAEWKSSFPFITHCQKRYPSSPPPSLKNLQQGPIDSLSEH